MATGQETVGTKNQYRYAPSHDNILSAIVSVITKVNSGQVTGYELGIYEKLQELKTRDKGVADLLDLDLDTLKEAQIISTLTEGISEYVFGEMSKVLLWDEDGTLQGLDLSENYWTKEQTLNEINKAIREGENQSDWLQTNPSSSTFIKNKPQSLSSFTNDQGFIRLSDVADRPTEDEVDAKIAASTEDLITNEDLENAIKSIDVSEDFGFATEEYVDNAVANAKIDTDVVATKEFIAEQGFLQADDLDGYATEAYVTQKIVESATGGEISLDGYATEIELNQGLQNIQNQLSSYATQTDLSDSVAALEETMLTEDDVADKFISKTDYYKNIHIMKYIPSAQLLYQSGYEALIPYEGSFVQIDNETPVTDRLDNSDVVFTGLVYVGQEFAPTVNLVIEETETDASNITTHNLYKVGTFQEKTPYYFYKTNAGGALMSIGLEDVTETETLKIATYKFVKPNGSYASLHKKYSLSDEVRSSLLLSATEEDLNGEEIIWTKLDPLDTDPGDVKGLKVFSFVNNTEYLLKVEQDSPSSYTVLLYSENPMVNIPTLDGYATENYVTSSISNLASKEFVNEKLAELPGSPDLSGYALSSYVDTQDQELRALINAGGSGIPTIEYTTAEAFCTSLSENNNKIVYLQGFPQDSLNGMVQIKKLVDTTYQKTITDEENFIRVITDYTEGQALTSEQFQQYTITYDFFTDTELSRVNSTPGVYKYELAFNRFQTLDEKTTISPVLKDEFTQADLTNIFNETTYISSGGLSAISQLMFKSTVESTTTEDTQATGGRQDSAYEVFNYNLLSTNKIKVTSEPTYTVTKVVPMVVESSGNGSATIDEAQLQQALVNYATKAYVASEINNKLAGGGEDGSGLDLSIYVTKEELPSLVPTSVSQLTNDAGYLSQLPENVLTEDNVSGKLNTLGYMTSLDVDDKIATLIIPTSTSQLANDSSFVDTDSMHAYVQSEVVRIQGGGTINLDAYATITYVDSKIPNLTNYLTKDGLVETLGNGTDITNLEDFNDGYIICQKGNKLYKLDPDLLPSGGSGTGGGSTTPLTFETENIDFSNLSFS